MEDGKSPAEAATVAGLTKDAIGKAMSGNAAAREFYNSELRALMHCGKSEGRSHFD